MTFPHPVRSLFISDAHLGFRFSQAPELLRLLERHDPDYLYLVGDFFDGWRLANKWYWTDIYTQIVDRVFELIRGGTRVFYTPGNHDDFMRGPIPAVYPVEVSDEFRHVAADGREYCIIHGDLFDAVEKNSKWLSGVGTKCYDIIMWSNKFFNTALRGVKVPEFNYAHMLKRLSKRCVGALNRYQFMLLQHARQQDCDGIICGHNHLPKLSEVGGFVYANSGDWVEHTSALIELTDGSLHLVNAGKRVSFVAGQLQPEPEVMSA